MVSSSHQIRVAKEYRPKTAYVPSYGLYQFHRVPFGHTNGPGTFQRVVNDIIQVLEADDDLAYLNEFICCHENWDDHIAAIDRIISLFKSSTFKLSGAKKMLVCTTR